MVLPTARGLNYEEVANLRLLQEFLIDSVGSTNINVNGAVTPVEFTITSSSTETRWIKSLRFLIEDENGVIASTEFRRFFSVVNGPLTNGLQIDAFQNGSVTAIASEPILTSGDFLNYATSYLNFADAIANGVDFLLIDFDFVTPVVLTPGSNDRLVVRVRDNLTAMNSFKCLAIGYSESL